MTNLENEKIANYLVILNKPGRKFSAEKDTRWGGLFEPGLLENPDKTDTGLRVVLFASWDYGYLILETMKEFEKQHPGELNLVGLVTDDPLNPDARISLKKRVWNLLDLPYRVIGETFVIESGLSHGIPVYIGEVKIPSFHNIIKQWNPDAILVCVFGQVIDSFMINLPPYGIYNFHPSDLSRGTGAGPAPYNDLVKSHADHTVWSVHHVSDEIDCGKLVGQSPPVNVLDLQRTLPGNPLVVYHKLAQVLSPLAYFLVKELGHNFRLNRSGGIDHIDFEKLIPEKIKNSIMLPVSSDQWTEVLSIPDGFLYQPG